MRLSGIACLSLFLLAALPAPAQVAPIDAPFEIASAEDSSHPPVLAARPDGTYLFLWRGMSPFGQALLGRILGPSGAPVTDPFLVFFGKTSSPAVAVFPDGGFVVVWELDDVILGAVFDRDGRERVLRFQIAQKERNAIQSEPAVAAGLDGGWMAVWQEDTLGSRNVFGRWFAAGGTPGAPPFPLSSSPAGYNRVHPGVATRTDGGFLAVWNEIIPPVIVGSDAIATLGRRFDATGAATSFEHYLTDAALVPRLVPLPGEEGFVLSDVGPPAAVLALQRLDAEGESLPRFLYVAAPEQPQFTAHRASAIDPAGRLLLVGKDKEHHPYGQLYDALLLKPLGAPFELATAKPAFGAAPLLASARPGQFLMVWEERERWMGEILAAGCAAPHLGLCLAQSRFRVEVSWRDHQGNTGQGHTVPLQDDTGAFWFFSASNAELLVKVLDGRSLNGHFWVFYGSLSDVEYEIRVTDTQTGDVRLYRNPAGTLASHADVRAFPPSEDPPPVSVPISTAAALPGPVRTISAPLIAPIECNSSEVALCLKPLYEVTINFVDPETGATRPARAVPFSQESGAFWFFDPDNLEIFVKVLDGTAVNGHTWVFYGGLTDVEYTLTVQGQDLNGGSWTYHNPRGRMSSGADTSALPPPAQE